MGVKNCRTRARYQRQALPGIKGQTKQVRTVSLCAQYVGKSDIPTLEPFTFDPLSCTTLRHI